MMMTLVLLAAFLLFIYHYTRYVLLPCYADDDGELMSVDEASVRSPSIDGWDGRTTPQYRSKRFRFSQEDVDNLNAIDGNFMSCTSASFQSANGSMGQTTMDDADSSVESSSLPDGNVLVTCVEKRDGRQE